MKRKPFADGLAYTFSMRESDTVADLKVYEGQRLVGRIQAMRTAPGADCRDMAIEMERLFPQVNRYGTWRVAKSQLVDEYLGRGYGRRMYEMLASELFERRGPFLFEPDMCVAGGTSLAARRVWESLAREFPSIGFEPRRGPMDYETGERTPTVGPGVIAILEPPRQLPRGPQANPDLAKLKRRLMR